MPTPRFVARPVSQASGRANANPGIDFRIYAHAVAGSQEQAADAMDALLSKAVRDRPALWA